MIGKHFYVVGVLCALISGPASGETIEVYSCNASEIEIGEGADLICVKIESDWLGDSAEPDDSFDGPVDEYDKSGGTKTKTKPHRPKGSGNPSAAVRHKATCKACTKAKDACVQASRASEQSCRQDARGQAVWRCEGDGRLQTADGEDRGGATPWGCGTYDLYEGKCPGVEAPWDEKEQWHPLKFSSDTLCEESWRLSHPGGTLSSSDGREYSATFHGVGASDTSTVSATYQLTGAQGYDAACTALGGSLMQGCAEKQSQCFNENACSPEDL